MRAQRIIRAVGLVLALGLTGCDRAPAPEAPVVTEPSAPPPDFRPHVGQSYTDLVTSPDTARYGVAQLGLSESAQARFALAMSLSAPAWIAEGGGTQAFIIVGCEAGACPEAAGVLAIDVTSGAVFAAVRDRTGRDVLVPNDRLAALVEATSPADRWDDPEAWAGEPAATAPSTP